MSFLCLPIEIQRDICELTSLTTIRSLSQTCHNLHDRLSPSLQKEIHLEDSDQLDRFVHATMRQRHRAAIGRLTKKGLPSTSRHSQKDWTSLVERVSTSNAHRLLNSRFWQHRIRSLILTFPIRRYFKRKHEFKGVKGKYTNYDILLCPLINLVKLHFVYDDPLGMGMETKFFTCLRAWAPALKDLSITLAYLTMEQLEKLLKSFKLLHTLVIKGLETFYIKDLEAFFINNRYNRRIIGCLPKRLTIICNLWKSQRTVSSSWFSWGLLDVIASSSFEEPDLRMFQSLCLEGMPLLYAHVAGFLESKASEEITRLGLRPCEGPFYQKNVRLGGRHRHIERPPSNITIWTLSSEESDEYDSDSSIVSTHGKNIKEKVAPHDPLKGFHFVVPDTSSLGRENFWAAITPLCLFLPEDTVTIPFVTLVGRRIQCLHLWSAGASRRQFLMRRILHPVDESEDEAILTYVKERLHHLTDLRSLVFLDRPIHDALNLSLRSLPWSTSTPTIAGREYNAFPPWYDMACQHSRGPPIM